MMAEQNYITIKNVRQNNLKNISLQIPKNKFVVVTGVSGSGKSSLVFDVINAEGQRQFFVNLSTQARKYLGKLSKPNVDEIKNLTPTISVSQNTSNNNPRSTVGTLTDVYDYLRLLFARVGESDKDLEINRSLFSFNSPTGACKNCKGLGVEDKISVDLLVEDENRTIRNQALKITNPNGYTIYSQVTIDALNTVCNAHNFNVDIAWKDLTEEEEHIILYGSDKITIPYGKHSLESRMKWSGITAKPRPEGFYKGIIPVMEEILVRDRNPNILRFAKTQICSKCDGSRLSEDALSVKINGKNIYYYSSLSIDDLGSELKKLPQNDVSKPIISEILKRINILQELGLGYLSLSRQATELSGGELQRIRLARQVGSKLRNVTFIFDEPSIGVHLANNKSIIKILKQLVANGNTVIVVEHDAQTILSADWIVDIGPKAGKNGGEVFFNGTKQEFLKSDYKSLTKEFLSKKTNVHLDFNASEKGSFAIKNAEINNLKNIITNFKINQLNCVTGISGAGKSSLINQTLIPLTKGEYHKQINAKGNPQLVDFNFAKTIVVNQSPIGKTVRSTPATYTKLHDLIRDFYAKLPESKELGFTKSTFSYNVKGGRCEKCQGAGKLEIGMHFLGNVETVCDVCNGKRYNDNILQVKHNGKTISDVLDMSVNTALEFFANEKKIAKTLQILQDIGLGYLQLGQSSNTLSGGEAQRIKLATELAKQSQTNTLFIFDEPTTGLHFADIQVLSNVFAKLLKKGNTIIVIEHNEDIIKNAHQIIDLHNGNVIYEGGFEQFLNCKNSITAKFLKEETQAVELQTNKTQIKNITFKGISTNNLKNIDVEIPENKHTVIVGPSGSGKSSLAFDTIYIEAQNRFTESFPAYVRQFASQNSKAKFTEVKGLTPAIALKQNNNITDPRSTLGTITEITDHYRLLFSRFGTAFCPNCDDELNSNYCQNCDTTFVNVRKASAFSVNNTEGVCKTCSGLGTVLTSDINLLVNDFGKSFFEGAFKKHKSLNFYADVNGQYLATLKQVGEKFNIDYSLPVGDLSAQAIDYAIFGTGDTEYNVEWEFKRNKRTGTHKFTGKWHGFVNLLLDEYFRKHANGKGDEMLPLLKETTCKTCNGQKFLPEVLAVEYNDVNISELSEMSVNGSIEFFTSVLYENKNECLTIESNAKQSSQLLDNILSKLKSIKENGLGYLSIDRQTRTLSNGELQRVLLSTILTGTLTGITYILDEPTTGLHPSDSEKIIKSINKLVENGNTVITVEHNFDLIKTANNIITIGPKAGIDGGEIISNNIDYILKYEKEFLNNYKEQCCHSERSEESMNLKIENATANNLKNISVEIPLNSVTAITGVSGSGKTSLMRDVLYKSYKANANINCDDINVNNTLLRAERSNLLNNNDIIWIDNKTPEKTTLSTMSTYTGVLEELRKIFAQTPEAKNVGLKSTDFSYNNKSGQCPECKGQGEIKVSLDFLSDVTSVCETCGGKRYKHNILQVKYNNKNIADILEMTVAEAQIFFSENKKLTKVFEVMQNLGLGYIKLGQATGNLSGGEVQRLKLAKEILSNNKKHNIYIFDEPAKGLQITDLHYLINTFSYLLEQGDTVIFIEHNPYLILISQYIIDLGGKTGGELIYQGELNGILKMKQSKTSKYLNGLNID